MKSENSNSMQLTSRKLMSDNQYFRNIAELDRIRQLYWEEGRSIQEIAAEYDVRYGAVYRYFVCNKLLSLGRKLSSKARTLIAKSALTQGQKELVFGTLLGDGCVRYFGKTAQYPKLTIMHGREQEGYIRWKAVRLEPFAVVYPTCNVSRNVFMLNTYPHPDFVRFREMFYEKGSKGVPEELSLLTPFAIAVWYCDDGYAAKAALCTHSFDVRSCRRLATIFKERYGIAADISAYRDIRRKVVYPEIRFKGVAAKQLHALIDPYIPDCMAYKRGH